MSEGQPPTCSKCGYNLTGLVSEDKRTTICPECGVPYDPAHIRVDALLRRDLAWRWHLYLLLTAIFGAFFILAMGYALGPGAAQMTIVFWLTAIAVLSCFAASYSAAVMVGPLQASSKIEFFWVFLMVLVADIFLSVAIGFLVVILAVALARLIWML